MGDSVGARVPVRLGDFVAAHAQQDTGGTWQLESKKMLEIHLDNSTVFTKMGAMIGYYGRLGFECAGAGSAGKFLKTMATGEKAATTKVTGSGILYSADQGKEITILHLDNESIFVNGSDCLAYSDSLAWDIVLTGGASMMAGGLFSLKLSGTGYVAITTHGRPLVLGVAPNYPLFTDPNATVAWSEGMQTSVKTDVNLKTFIGRASGETLQMRFDGQGFVVVQPYEEVVAASGGGS
ncbi:MAG TPA: AIM24 family protein [Actinobacteria bacterium]|nr:AIM24 family protein [Actinomycetota bacterium]